MSGENRLGGEKSPYLLQHKNNPIDWYPWCAEAFTRAAEENKPVFLSIGYSSCYWCHVMEHECFEDEEVANFLNSYFVSVKVDREERPDIDQIYMDAVVALTGQGGWPLSVMLTPDGEPFFGGTYFPRDTFLVLLQRVNDAWLTQRERVVESASRLTDALGSQVGQGGREEPDAAVLKQAFYTLRRSFDSENGGFSGPPKFPSPLVISLLLKLHRRTGNEEMLHMAVFSLEKMIRGGIFDQLGGGFHRYSVDAVWLVPHFEKMLYDNALLATAALEGYQITRRPILAGAAKSVLDYMLREMKDPAGGFYSAQDAGEVGKEGEYFLWTEKQAKSVLTDTEFVRAKEVLGIKTPGNFEGEASILTSCEPFPWEVREDPVLRSAMGKLLAARSMREKPATDDKVLTSWNALAVSSFCKGFQVLEDEQYLRAAEGAVEFIKENLYREGLLLRRYRAGEAKYSGYLDDYAYLIRALLDLYESSLNSACFAWAETLQHRVDQDFWDEENQRYFYSGARGEKTIVRRHDIMDTVIPSGNGVSAQNLLRLYLFTGKEDYRAKAAGILASVSQLMTDYPAAFCSMLSALDYMLDKSKQVIVVGDSASPPAALLRQFLYQEYLPNKVLAFSQADGAVPLLRDKGMIRNQTTFYVCENNHCLAPTTEVEEAKKMVSAVAKFSV